MPSVTIVGIGRVGGAFAVKFRGSEYTIRNLIGNKSGQPSSDVVDLDAVHAIAEDVVLLTVPDDQLVRVATDIARKIKNAPVVLHTSGPLSSDILKPLADIGCSVGSVHPLVSFTSAESGAKELDGAYFCVEGDTRAVETAMDLISYFGGISFEVPTANKVLYHAAAVAACGHLTALIDVSQVMLEKAGVDREMASKILIPLIKSTVKNIAEQGTDAALTGTFARTDVAGFERQLATFSGKLTRNETEIYLSLAERSIEIALRNGADQKRITRIEELLSLAKSELR